MNQLESNSRRKSTAPGGKTGSGKKRSSGGVQMRGTGQTRYSGSRRSRKKKKGIGGVKVAILLLVLCVVGITGIYAAKTYPAWQKAETETVPETTADPGIPADRVVTAAGVSLSGLTRAEAKEALTERYPWSMNVTFGSETYELPNLMDAKIEGLLDEIYGGEVRAVYELDTAGLEEAVNTEVEKMAAKWDKPARNGTLAGYDKATDTFTFQGEEKGVVVDREKLAADISQALQAKNFGAALTAEGREAVPEISGEAATQRYKTIATFTTKTTSNSARNTNIRLACEALNGTILQPGEELSFNKTVGQRTRAKGYKGAAAYNNGEVVQEIGGGVCQLSTTLYNATVKAGLKITKRQSHTFEPSYITPGQDATVSWQQPDFHFVNNSVSAIGIRASYASQKVTVSIYGIPILEEGVEYSLKSRKLADLGVPAPTYIEDSSLPPGTQVVKSSGTRGSRWETRLVITKNGEVVSQEVDHTVSYKGHAPVIRRNSAAAPVTESATDVTVEPTAGETAAGTGEIGPGVNLGPGATTEAPAGPGDSSGPGALPTAGPGAPETEAATTAAPAPAPTPAPAPPPSQELTPAPAPAP